MAFLFRQQDSTSPYPLRTKKHQSDNMAAAAMLKIRTPEEAGTSGILQ